MEIPTLWPFRQSCIRLQGGVSELKGRTDVYESNPIVKGESPSLLRR